ncbi:unnamed protein product [Sphagnum tenellum]
METKGGKKSKKSSIQYESPLGYGIEDVRPHGGSEKFRTAAYSNVRVSTTSISIFFLCAEAILIFAIHIGVDNQCPAQGSRFPSIFPLSISLVGNS